MTAYIVKATPVDAGPGEVVTFVEKTMYGGKKIAPGDEVFVFASDHEGGRGLSSRGTVLGVAPGPGIRLTIMVRLTAMAKRPFGRVELKDYRERTDASPETEIARRFYRQATNKIGGISEAAADLLKDHF
ncbi:hypothetical protein [Pseudoruegeria sp. HB172150]|uniref:hypothetical protein n=1 Tax=Pseudoruegeria sp. HB172150 TaxID=2721164 RepID=UPI001C1313FC|nr:hypothetical protein [Pseudoruegeria sp. HB172150]